MDCGIPFCHEGCPLGNLIPEWNDLVYRDDWSEAIERLHATNNFPEFTGRLCPAPCEGACVLGINDDPVTIERIEYEIIERAWSEGWVDAGAARRPQRQAGGGGGLGPGRTGRRPAAGPGRAPRWWCSNGRRSPGGLLRYGIPEFKMEKAVLDRRLDQMSGRGGRVPVRGLGGGVRPRGAEAPWLPTARVVSGPVAGGRVRQPWCWPAGPPCPGTCRSPVGSWPGSSGPWTISSRPTWSRRAASTRRRSRPRASTW